MAAAESPLTSGGSGSTSGVGAATGPLSPSASITTLEGCGSASSLSCTTTAATSTVDTQRQQPVNVSVIYPSTANVMKTVPSYSEAARTSIGATISLAGHTIVNNNLRQRSESDCHNDGEGQNTAAVTGCSETSGCGTGSNSSSLCTNSCCCVGYGCERQLSITPPSYSVRHSLLGPATVGDVHHNGHIPAQQCCTTQCCSCSKPPLMQTPNAGAHQPIQHHGMTPLGPVKLERDVHVPGQLNKADTTKVSTNKLTPSNGTSKYNKPQAGKPHMSGSNQAKSSKAGTKKGNTTDKQNNPPSTRYDMAVVEQPPLIFSDSYTGLTFYQFEIPQIHVGRLIGKQGTYVNLIRRETGASVIVNKHPFSEDSIKIVHIEGRPDEIKGALDLIRDRFPLGQYPEISFSALSLSATPLLAHPHHHPHMSHPFNNQIHSPNISYNGSLSLSPAHAALQQSPTITMPVPELSQLFLPEAVLCDVIVCSIESAGHIFLQQPSHPSYHGLELLKNNMMQAYSDPDRVPSLPSVKVAGMICACPLAESRDTSSSLSNGSRAANMWYRCQIIQVPQRQAKKVVCDLSASECLVKLVDKGGFHKVNMDSLRQIRQDFMSLPFQAVEVLLAGVSPKNDSEGWCDAAKSLICQLTNSQVLQAEVKGYADNGLPCVVLMMKKGSNVTTLNAELVEHGYAKWINEVEVTRVQPSCSLSQKKNGVVKEHVTTNEPPISNTQSNESKGNQQQCASSSTSKKGQSLSNKGQ